MRAVQVSRIRIRGVAPGVGVVCQQVRDLRHVADLFGWTAPDRRVHEQVVKGKTPMGKAQKPERADLLSLFKRGQTR